MTSIEFHRRVSTVGRECRGSLFVRVIHRRRARSVTLSFRLFADEWDEARHCIRWENVSRQRSDLLRRADSEMTRVSGMLWQIVARLSVKGVFTVEDITDRYRMQVKGGLIYSFTEELCREMIRQGQVSSVRSYMTAVRRLERFMGKQDLSFRDLTTAEIVRFEKALWKEGLGRNTTSSYMRSLRAIYNKAVEMGVTEPLPYCPFAGVFTGVEQTRKRALTAAELSAIIHWSPDNMTDHKRHKEAEETQKELFNHDGHDVLEVKNNLLCENLRLSASSAFSHTIKQLQRARQLFMFGFLAQGMSFVDMAYLRKKDIKGNMIRYHRRKTRQTIEVEITPELQACMDYFREEVKDSPYVLPIIRRPGENERLQYESALRLQNKWLKRLATQICFAEEKGEREREKGRRDKPIGNQISKISYVYSFLPSPCTFLLSTHVARHSWATLAKQLNLPIGIISECLGHTSEKTTRIYLGAFDSKIIAEANRKIVRLIS